MPYKLLLLDVDGTLVPVGPHTTPSEKVVRFLDKAKDKVAISLVSGRPANWLTEIFDILDLTAPCIINGGAQIIDPITKGVIWEKAISERTLDKIIALAKAKDFSFLVNDGGIEYRDPVITEFIKPIAIQVSYLGRDEIDEFLAELRSTSEVTAYPFPSWKEGLADIYITHKEAGKFHAVEKLAKLLNISKSQIIAVGDGANDLPLFKASGLKIAMGNAAENLKEAADYIAPSVQEDGVVN